MKCDRGQPYCGWCSRNGATCEYKERKKPGLRAGYGRELEQRLDRLEDILRQHSHILETSFVNSNHSNSIHSGDHDTPQSTSSLFRQNEGRHIPHAETALFLQKPSNFPPSSQAMDFANAMPQTPSMQSMHGDMFQQQQQTHSTQIPMPMQQQNHPPSIHSGGQAPEFYSTGQPPLASPSLNIDQQGNSVSSSDHALPPYDLLYALVDLYFKYVNSWCPILHRRSTLDSVRVDPIIFLSIVTDVIAHSCLGRRPWMKPIEYCSMPLWQPH